MNRQGLERQSSKLVAVYEVVHERPFYEQAFDQALLFATQGLSAERVMVCFSGNGKLYGLEAERLWSSEWISLTLLRSLVERRQPTVISDAMEQGPAQVTSVTLSSIRSILFVPIGGRNGEISGFLYLDNRLKKGIFKDKDLKQLEAVVSGSVEPHLAQIQVSRPLSWDLLQNTCWL